MNKVFGVIGLGSMGKRRIRCLKHLGYSNIIGYDPRTDRSEEVNKLYGVECTSDIEDFYSRKFDFWIISTPPDIHYIFMQKSYEKKIPTFIEASVVDTNMLELINISKGIKNIFYPSCTFLFHPGIILISKLLNEKYLGDITNVLYHSGQYLPDWHTYEKVSDYYVSKKETGGAREIVPFELTWLTKIFGFPKQIVGFCKKTVNLIGAEEIDDTYNILADYPKMVLNLSVDVVSRCATRKLLINGSKGQLSWNWDDNFVNVFTTNNLTWDKIEYEQMPANNGYNKNITEEMYINEISCFINAVEGENIYPNSLIDDYRVLNLLYSCEKSQENKVFIQDENWNINIS